MPLAALYLVPVMTSFVHRLIRYACAALLLIALTGCSTPASRIRKSPEVFAGFPPDVQARVRLGEIETGYTPDMVRMAKGQPDRQYQRTTAAGETEIWSYVGVRRWTDRQQVHASFRVRDGSGRLRTVHDSVWVDVDHEREYERLRVEFKDGKVQAVETLSP